MTRNRRSSLRSLVHGRRERAIAAAVLEERRRMARDLHDGLAQELAFLSTETRRLKADRRPERIDALADAADRALDESRAAIAALRREGDEPFAAEVSRVAEQLAARAGARIELDLADVEVDPERRDHLLRLIREALANGIRHGEATELHVELSGAAGLRLVVRDNGRGFDPSPSRREGAFGLLGMRERARAIGAELRIRSSLGRGTEVEVTLP
jgi:signal transduction histidine kinase